MHDIIRKNNENKINKGSVAMRKPGPKDNLIEGQEDELNKMFYRDYMMDYFDEKLTILINILSETDEYFSKLVSKEMALGKLKFKTMGDVDYDELKKHAKCEIIETYYHCLETFIRLFIAHATFERCPLMELTALGIHEYHKILNRLAEGNFDGLNSQFDGEDTMLLVLIGSTKSDKQVNEEQVNNLKEWIIFSANELQRMNHYNSFKHGLSMFAGFGSIKIQNPKMQKEIFKEGDAIHVLKSEEAENQYKFSLTNIFIEYDYKATLILFFNELIKNIITVGKVRYVTNDYNTRIGSIHLAGLSYKELNKIFERDNINNLIESYSQLLIYKDDLKMQEHEEVKKQ